jgi:predicted RNA binding protein YcfA (HicA-like mRNA interferase family)
MKSLSGREMCRALERNGWKHVRTKGSHFRYAKPGQADIVVPVHGGKSLKRGMQQAIMKQAGLTEADL